MDSMHVLLTEAERDWREEVKRDFPLRSNTPVIRSSPKMPGRDWEFSTDLHKIYAAIAHDERLKERFAMTITKFWDGDAESLARDTLHYLLFHELYHPVEAPFSVSGDDNDNKRIHQAIRRGLVHAEPDLSPLEQVVRVQASQNGVKDFILDNRFFLDNQQQGYVREDIIPTWDVLELEGSPAKTNFYTITRYLYGALYGPEAAFSFFEDKAGSKGVGVAEQAMKALIGEDVSLPRRRSLASKAKSVFGSNGDEAHNLEDYVRGVRRVFSGTDRYAGIERLMSVLGPYVEQGMPQGRPDMQGAGSGASPQNILQDLLDDMSSEEQAVFVAGLSENGEAEDFGEGEPNSITSFEATTQELNTLDVFAMHEFYKRNHPSVRIVGSEKVGESVVVGKQEYWNLKRSNVLTEDQLSRVNLQRINLLQRRTRLPWLMDLGNGTYRLNEYELRERDIKDIRYVDAHLDVPDMVEFYVDSSGSMYQHGNEHGFNDGSRWDMLSNVLYGFVDALVQGGREVGKESQIQIHNFADSQKSSPVISAQEFWHGNTDVLKVLFKPENGYSHEDIDIDVAHDNLKRAYVVVTDGNLVLGGRTEREARKMRELAQRPNYHAVLFEIGGTYDFGNAVRGNPSITYHPVHDKGQMLSAGLEVLLAK